MMKKHLYKIIISILSILILSSGIGIYALNVIVDDDSEEGRPISFSIDGLITKKADKPIVISVVGNSILQHGVKEDIGWYTVWGMAASSADKDYFHLLKDKHVADNFGEVIWNKIGAYPTESIIVAKDDYDYKSAFEKSIFNDIKKSIPDVVILQMGENVSASGLTADQYENALKQLTDGLLEINPDMQIIFSTGFWGGSSKVNAVKSISEKTGFSYADIATLNTNENKAIGLFEHSGVASHPGDLGMSNIAKLFYEKLEPLLEELYQSRMTQEDNSYKGFSFVKEYPNNYFTDVNSDAWYYNEVKNAYRLDLINGKSEGIFDPDGNMTIAEAITLSVRLYKKSQGEEFVAKQENDEEWYEPYVREAVLAEIIYENEFSDFDKAVTRAEMCMLFAKALDENILEEINNFKEIPDLEESSPFYSYVLSFYNSGILIGTNENFDFLPDNNIKRSEVAAILSRIALPDLRITIE